MRPILIINVYTVNIYFVPKIIEVITLTHATKVYDYT